MAVKPSPSPALLLRYALETAAAYIIYGVFWLLPLEKASDLGGWILSRLGPKIGVSKVALKNISLAFPDKNEEEKQKILFGMWDNLGRVIAEYPHLHRIMRKIEVHGQEHLGAARDSEKPALFFAGHLANWEINAVTAKMAGLPLYLIYRAPNNPWVDSLLCHARNSGAAGHIKKGREGAREIFSLLRKNQSVGFLMDQKLNEGMPIPFFGHDAMTASAIAQFALKFGCPVYPTRVERIEKTHFRVTTFPALEIKKTDNPGEDIKTILKNINQLLETWIRDRPEQWLWLHRRWPEQN